MVLGHAFGQWIARTLAADRPDLVRGVVLAAAAAKSANRRRCATPWRNASIPALPEAERRAALRFAFFAPGHDPPDPGCRLASGGEPEASARRVPRRRRRNGGPPGRAPVLDMQAEHDPWRPADTRNGILDDLGAGRVTVVVIPDASHALIPEQPAAVVRAVRDWTRTI